MDRIYLDNNATTMVDPLVRDEIIPFFTGFYGNSNSLHYFGIEVHPFMRLAMDRLYEGFGANEEDDIIINSCATEGNNTVIMSTYYQEIKEGKKNHIITSQIEHPSVRETFRFLENLGVEVSYLPVNKQGIISPDILRRYIRPGQTALVSIMWANNETGLIQPIKELLDVTKEAGALFHTDAVQAVGKIPVNLSDCPVDFLTISAHKFHGPKGVGALYVKKGLKLIPLLHGGEHMGGYRAGTVNVGGMVGMGLALELANKALDYELTEVRKRRDRLEDAILQIEDTLVIGDRELRVPNTILASFRGIEGEAMIWDLNRQGIAASTGSACASESLEANPTFVAMQLNKDLAHTGVRFSLSRYTTDDEIDQAIKMIQSSVKRLREISSSY